MFTTLGTVLGALPFVLEYRAFLKVVEVNALGAAVDQIQNLEKFTAQIAASTDQWTRVHGSGPGGTPIRLSPGPKEIAERMAAEVREFAEFQQKMNDTETRRPPAGS